MIKAIKKAILIVYETLAKWYLSPLLVMEWKKPRFAAINERAIEYGFVFHCLANLCPAEVLDVGSGKSAFPQVMATGGFRVTAIDRIKGYWRMGYFNRHFHVISDDVTHPRLAKQFDLITCISVLEHIPNHRDAMTGMFNLLKKGGHLVLTCPYNETQYVEDIYRHPDAGYGQESAFICQVYSRKELDGWLTDNGGEIVEQEYYQIFSGDLWSIGGRVYPPRKVSKDDKHHLTCLLIRKN